MYPRLHVMYWQRVVSLDIIVNSVIPEANQLLWVQYLYFGDVNNHQFNSKSKL